MDKGKPEGISYEREYTLREASDMTTISYSALRGRADRGNLEYTGGGKPGIPRKVTRRALQEAGVLTSDEVPLLAVNEVREVVGEAVGELSTRISALETEVRHMREGLEEHII